MPIYRAQLRNTSNALTFRMSGKQIRLQVPPKLLNDSNIHVLSIHSDFVGFGISSMTGRLQKQIYYGCPYGGVEF